MIDLLLFIKTMQLSKNALSQREFQERKRLGIELPKCSNANCERRLLSQKYIDLQICYLCYLKTPSGKEENNLKQKDFQRRKKEANSASSSLCAS